MLFFHAHAATLTRIAGDSLRVHRSMPIFCRARHKYERTTPIPIVSVSAMLSSVWPCATRRTTSVSRLVKGFLDMFCLNDFVKCYRCIDAYFAFIIASIAPIAVKNVFVQPAPLQQACIVDATQHISSAMH